MSPLPISTIPPPSHESYLLDQLAGERITLPGSKGVFRILASSAQTSGGMAVFTSGAVLSDAPGFHWHQEAHDVFLVTKGFLRLWNGDKCRILGPGDFAYVPPVSFQFLVALVALVHMYLQIWNAANQNSQIRKSSIIRNFWDLTPKLSVLSRLETGWTFSGM
jgi:uncharacterized RmlC-like cupin family protein